MFECWLYSIQSLNQSGRDLSNRDQLENMGIRLDESGLIIARYLKNPGRQPIPWQGSGYLLKKNKLNL